MNENVGLFKKLNIKLKSLNRFSFVLILTVSLYFSAIVINLILDYFKEKDIILFDTPDNLGPVGLFIVGVLIAPLFETWLCQSLPYRLLNKLSYFRKRNFLILLISAVWFGLNHF
jgi:uncharacterized protein